MRIADVGRDQEHGCDSVATETSFRGRDVRQEIARLDVALLCEGSEVSIATDLVRRKPSDRPVMPSAFPLKRNHASR